MDNFFAMDTKELIVLLILLVLVIIALRVGRKKGKETRANKLMKKYKVMERSVLDGLPDGELVDAVVSRVLANAENSTRPDPLKVLAEMPYGNTVVYSTWVICKELASSDFATLQKMPSAELIDRAETAFRILGADDCAATFTTLRNATGDGIAPAEAAFHAAVERECPLTLCEQYIREHTDEFAD